MMQCAASKTGVLTIAMFLFIASRMTVPAGEPQPSTQNQLVVESFTIDPSLECLVVPVRIGNSKYQFVLDTGCGITVFDNRLKGHLAEPLGKIDTATQNSRRQEDYFAAPRTRMGTLELPRDELVVCLDMGQAREVSGCDIDGILGNRTLRNWIVQFDFDRNRIEFIEPKASREAYRGEPIRFVLGDNGLMRIIGTIGEYQDVPFTIDTGNCGSLSLSRPSFDSASRSRDLQVDHVGEWVNVHGSNRSPEGLVSKFTVGPFRHRGLRAMCTGDDAIGLPYLRRYHVTIDFPNERIYLVKGKRYDDPEESIDRSGLLIVRRAGAFVVDTVDDGSPGKDVDIRPGDHIVEIQGRKSTDCHLSEIRRFLRSRDSTPVRLSIRRDKELKEIAVHLRDMTFAPRPREEESPIFRDLLDLNRPTQPVGE